MPIDLLANLCTEAFAGVFEGLREGGGLSHAQGQDKSCATGTHRGRPPDRSARDCVHAPCTSLECQTRHHWDGTQSADARPNVRTGRESIRVFRIVGTEPSATLFRSPVPVRPAVRHEYVLDRLALARRAEAGRAERLWLGQGTGPDRQLPSHARGARRCSELSARHGTRLAMSGFAPSSDSETRGLRCQLAATCARRSAMSRRRGQAVTLCPRLGAR
jgi:hypothetical protein